MNRTIHPSPECAPPFYGPDCADICSASCDDFRCTFEGYCRSCPNGTGGPRCFEGCAGDCEFPNEERENTTGATMTTQAQHHGRWPRNGAEVFKYLAAVPTPLLCVFCFCAFGKFRSKKTKARGIHDKPNQDTDVDRSTDNKDTHVTESIINKNQSVVTFSSTVDYPSVRHREETIVSKDQSVLTFSSTVDHSSVKNSKVEQEYMVAKVELEYRVSIVELEYRVAKFELEYGVANLELEYGVAKVELEYWVAKVELEYGVAKVELENRVAKVELE
ncbi:hypothetical protein Btru_070338 [Bulinus truncatus]|nr:hypothetical protein Btru_070338 [Bulinus truncatus]